MGSDLVAWIPRTASKSGFSLLSLYPSPLCVDCEQFTKHYITQILLRANARRWQNRRVIITGSKCFKRVSCTGHLKIRRYRNKIGCAPLFVQTILRAHQTQTEQVRALRMTKNLVLWMMRNTEMMWRVQSFSEDLGRCRFRVSCAIKKIRRRCGFSCMNVIVQLQHSTRQLFILC